MVHNLILCAYNESNNNLLRFYDYDPFFVTSVCLQQIR